MHQSDTIAELAKALAQAQGEIENANKGSKNPHFNNKYADLAEVLNTVRPVFSKYGLSVTQHAGSVYLEGKLHAVVETQVQHSSGEWQRSVLLVPVAKADAQGLGGAVTYGRRYGLSAVAGIAQEDDDGNAASGAAAGRKPSEKKEPAPAPTRSTDLEGPAAEYLQRIRAAKSTAELQGAVEGLADAVKNPADVAALQIAFKERLAALKPSGPRAVP